MDDPKFDDLLRDKLRNFQDPRFDPESLDDLHQRMAGVQSPPSWVSTRIVAIGTAALFLLTALNFFLLMNRDTDNVGDQLSLIQVASPNVIDSLSKEIERLQCELNEHNAINSNQNISYANARFSQPIFRLIAVSDNAPNDDVQYRYLAIGS
jgi:hypothetical protein